MVVLVLMTSCHVSLKPNSGPVAPQSATIRHAQKNADGRPVACDVAFAKVANQEEDFVGLMNHLRPPRGAVLVSAESMGEPGNKASVKRVFDIGMNGVYRSATQAIPLK